MTRECHPLLRGGRRGSKYTHGFSSAEMESLGSICEALLPPLQMESLNSMENNPTSKAMQFFWKASGSQFSVPDEVPPYLCHSLSVSLSHSIVYFFAFA